jgi:ABC-type Fe3+/spermidine/putrescine transport system ATPase subunit
VTHDQEEAMSLSDRVAVMSEGRVVELAPPRTLYLRPQTGFAARFVGQADLIDCALVERADGSLIVDSAFGRLRAEGAPSDVSGELSLLVRPEHIELKRPEGECVRNEVDGVIDKLVFSGRIVEYFVRAAGRVVRVQGTSREIHEAGSAVRLVLPPEHCVVVRGRA